MRKIAVVAILAIVAAMVPASLATATPTPGSLDGVGTVMFVNSYTSAVDVWIRIDGTFQKFTIGSPGQKEVQIPVGDHAYQVCLGTPTSDDETCAGSGPLGAPGSMHIGENDIINGLIAPGLAGPTGLNLQQNSTEQTETDHAQLTIFNGIPAPVDMCVNGEHVISLAPNGGTVPRQLAEFDSKDGEGQPFLIYVGTFAVDGGVCGNTSPAAPISRDQGFPSGSNTVVNLTINDACTSDCGYQIFPGEEPPSTSQQVDAFCAVVLDAANITPWLQALFDEVEVGNEDTYPSSEKVEKVLTRIAELLEKGNQTAPKDILPVWLRATAAFVETGRLAAVGYDIANLSQDDLRSLIDGVEHPGADDSEEAADTAALTAWVTTNCFGTTAIEAEPSFTG